MNLFLSHETYMSHEDKEFADNNIQNYYKQANNGATNMNDELFSNLFLTRIFT